MDSEQTRALLDRLNSEDFDVLSAFDIAEETLTAVGHEQELNGVRVPAPTAACLCLLQAIDSPFLREPSEDEPARLTLKDVADALYVFCEREEAVRAVFAHVRARRLYSDLKDEALKVEAIVPFAHALADFDAQSLAHFEKFGACAVEQATQLVVGYITTCTRGFEMIKQDGAGAKKNAKAATPSTTATASSGWRRLWRLLRWPFAS